MKHLYSVLLTLLIGQSASPQVWKMEIKDLETSEVKTYSFSEAKMHQIQLPKFKTNFCGFSIGLIDVPGEPPTKAQIADLSCFYPSGGMTSRQVCSLPVSMSDKLRFTTAVVIEDDHKTKKPKEKEKVQSYLIQFRCE